MELLQLRYFLKSAQTENFSLTAAEYMVPPSTVSVSIKKLEEELGIKLFNRSANRLKLNATGKRFADAVGQALSLIDSQALMIKEEQLGISGDIRLLIRTERSFVTSKMISFRHTYNMVNFHLIHDHGAVDPSKYDVIIDETSERYVGFSQKLLVTEKIKIAASRKSKLMSQTLCLLDLKDVPFITLSRGSSLYRISESSCLQAGFKPKFVIESDDPYYIRKYIEDDFGIAFFPEASWKNDEDNIGFLTVTDFDYTRKTYAYLNTSDASKIAKLFFEYL